MELKERIQLSENMKIRLQQIVLTIMRLCQNFAYSQEAKIL